MIKILKNYYRIIVKNYLDKNSIFIPFEYQSSYVHFGGGFDVTGIVYSVLKRHPKNIKILLIGVFGCRDYFFLKNKNFENIYTIDIQPQKYISLDFIGSIEDFVTEKKFDIIIMFEVLEHLKFDTIGLLNIRKCLVDDGELLISVPFYNDIEKSHIRIYSDVSITRLFETCGFFVKDRFYRPGFFWLKYFNYFIHILNILSFFIFKRHIYDFIKKRMIRLEIYFSKFKFFNFLRKYSNHFGCIYVLNKSSFFDYIKLNNDMYKNK